jgi:hypothetical protein
VGQPGKPPCRRCVREQRECVLAGSRRGGRRIRKNKVDTGAAELQPGEATLGPPALEITKSSSNLQGNWQSHWNGNEASDTFNHFVPSPNINPSVDKAIASAEIQNTSDALEILAQVAGDAQADRATSTAPTSDITEQVPPTGLRNGTEGQALFMFPPLVKGTMSLTMINDLFTL